jgi:hypothetical protein
MTGHMGLPSSSITISAITFAATSPYLIDSRRVTAPRSR